MAQTVANSVWRHAYARVREKCRSQAPFTRLYDLVGRVDAIRRLNVKKRKFVYAVVMRPRALKYSKSDLFDFKISVTSGASAVCQIRVQRCSMVCSSLLEAQRTREYRNQILQCSRGMVSGHRRRVPVSDARRAPSRREPLLRRLARVLLLELIASANRSNAVRCLGVGAGLELGGTRLAGQCQCRGAR